MVDTMPKILELRTSFPDLDIQVCLIWEKIFLNMLDLLLTSDRWMAASAHQQSMRQQQRAQILLLLARQSSRRRWALDAFGALWSGQSDYSTTCH